MEAAERSAKELQGTAGNIVHRVYVRKGGRARGNLKAKCYRCLGNHNPSNCKYRTSECYNCKKMGHLARACCEWQGSESTRMNHLRDSGRGPAEEDEDEYLLF